MYPDNVSLMENLHTSRLKKLKKVSQMYIYMWSCKLYTGVEHFPLEELYACILLKLFDIFGINTNWIQQYRAFFNLKHKKPGDLDVLGKNSLNIRFKQEQNTQRDELFFLGFEKGLKMQVSMSIEPFWHFTCIIVIFHKDVK